MWILQLFDAHNGSQDQPIYYLQSRRGKVDTTTNFLEIFVSGRGTLILARFPMDEILRNSNFLEPFLKSTNLESSSGLIFEKEGLTRGCLSILD